MSWAEDRGFAIHSAVNERLGFLRRTYTHLLVEICLVGAVAFYVLHSPALLDGIAKPLMGNLILYLLAFFGVSLVSRRLMAGRTSSVVQYSGAGLWVLFLGFLIAPFAWYIQQVTGSFAILGQAFVMTACIFTGLTAYVFYTRKDFSAWGGAIGMITMAVFGVSVVMAFMGGGGGIIYSLVWVVLMGGWVLYDTSNILHRRHVDQHVAASVDLLVDFVYMFINLAMLILGGSRR